MVLTTEEQAMRDDVFWEELQRYSIEQVEEAFHWARGELRFFPKPIELTDYIYQISHQKYLESQPEEVKTISWMEPTEEGKKLAIEMFSELKQRWTKEDKEREAQRRVEFERRRAHLKKQANLLLKNGKGN